jgi:hypothetical protein
MTNRRAVITLLGGAALAWPLAARAQQAGKLPTTGFSAAGTPTPSHGAFTQRPRELGWIEGRTVAIEYRQAEGRPERFAEIEWRSSPRDYPGGEGSQGRDHDHSGRLRHRLRSGGIGSRCQPGAARRQSDRSQFSQ